MVGTKKRRKKDAKTAGKAPAVSPAPEPVRRTGRPPAFATEADFLTAVDAYIEHCRTSFQMPNKAGARYFLRISADTWSEYRKRFPEAHKEAEDYIENAWVQRLAGTTPTGAIFYLKNAFRDDYKDRHENDNMHRFDKFSMDDIRALAGKLPKEQQDALYATIATALAGGEVPGSTT